MKYLCFLIPFLATKLTAQTVLNFNKRFVQSEDKWVAFQPGKDSSYPFGFIYIDAQAGLTLNYEGSFKVLPNGTFVAQKLDSTNMKVRLQPNNVQVAFIPESKFQELQITSIPDWLQYYKADSNTTGRLYRWGFMYNGWGECETALSYLLKAQQKDPGFKGLSTELAYSYNCLGRYDSAIAVLKEALQANPKDAYTNKELIYAQIKSGKIADAAESCKKAIAVCTDQTYHGENCYNLLYTCFIKKDKNLFTAWISETKKWNSKNEKLLKSIAAMEAEMNK